MPLCRNLAFCHQSVMRMCHGYALMTPYKSLLIGLVPNVKNQAIFGRICMESLEHNCGNISPTICTTMLIFGKDTFLVLISRVISTDPISSHSSVFVKSHFNTFVEIKETNIVLKCYLLTT